MRSPNWRALDIPIVAVTLGPDGVGAWNRGRFAVQPTFPSKVVDAVEADDAFLGTFCAAPLEAAPLTAALRRGAAACALVVARPGVYGALPTRAEVDAYLERVAAWPRSSGTCSGRRSR